MPSFQSLRIQGVSLDLDLVWRWVKLTKQDQCNCGALSLRSSSLFFVDSFSRKDQTKRLSHNQRERERERNFKRTLACMTQERPALPTKVFNSTSHSAPKDLWKRNLQTRFESRLFPESRSFWNSRKVVLQFSDNLWLIMICLDRSTSLIQHWMMSKMQHQESTRVCKMFLWYSVLFCNEYPLVN